MRRFGNALQVTTGVVLFLAVAGDAQAYLDPGTTGLVVQAVLATIATGLLFFRRTWTRLKSRLFGGKALPEEAGESSSRHP